MHKLIKEQSIVNLVAAVFEIVGIQPKFELAIEPKPTAIIAAA